MHQNFMRGEDFMKNRIILHVWYFMLTMKPYRASDDMFWIIQQNTNRTFWPSVSFNPFENGFFTNTAYAVSGLIMKIIKDLIIHKKKRRLRLWQQRNGTNLRTLSERFTETWEQLIQIGAMLNFTWLPKVSLTSKQTKIPTRKRVGIIFSWNTQLYRITM